MTTLGRDQEDERSVRVTETTKKSVTIQPRLDENVARKVCVENSFCAGTPLPSTFLGLGPDA